MFKYSFTLSPSIGDAFLDYLDSPGAYLHHILKLFPNEVELRIPANRPAVLDLIKGNPFFSTATSFNERPNYPNRLKNDISGLTCLKDLTKLMPPLWLDENEEKILHDLKKPYAVLHPFASAKNRYLDIAFDIYKLSQYIADNSGIPLIVLGKEEFNYESKNVKQIKGSVRLAVKLVENSSFFVGSHSSLQCAGWIFKIPSFCLIPSNILFHALYAPNSYDKYLEPLFRDKNLTMMFEDNKEFGNLFDHFLRNSTNLIPHFEPKEYQKRLNQLPIC